MKRMLAILLGLAVCLLLPFSAIAAQTEEYAVGSHVTFGHYEQNNNLEDGKEPLEWVVLKVDGNQALLITQQCIDARAYHTRFVAMTWAECALRTWLNTDFLEEAFSAEEQAAILTTTIHNPNNPHYGTKGGDDTTDKVFLLSLAEAYEFFPEHADRQAEPTEYAKARGAYVEKASGRTWWMLRSPGVRRVDICGVRADGRISGYGSRDVDRPSGALRPVIWVSFETP